MATATQTKQTQKAQPAASAATTAQLLSNNDSQAGMVPVNVELGDGLTVTALRLTPANRKTGTGTVAGYVTMVFNRRLRVRGYKIWVPADRTKPSDLLPPVQFQENGKPFNYVTLPESDRQAILAELRRIAESAAKATA